MACSSANKRGSQDSFRIVHESCIWAGHARNSVQACTKICYGTTSVSLPTYFGQDVVLRDLAHSREAVMVVSAHLMSSLASQHGTNQQGTKVPRCVCVGRASRPSVASLPWLGLPPSTHGSSPLGGWIFEMVGPHRRGDELAARRPVMITRVREFWIRCRHSEADKSRDLVRTASLIIEWRDRKGFRRRNGCSVEAENRCGLMMIAHVRHVA